MTAIEKRLDHFKKNKPVQLELFFLDVEEKKLTTYSRSIEIYDLSPKYFRGKKLERVEGKYLKVLNRNYFIGDVAYNCSGLKS